MSVAASTVVRFVIAQACRKDHELTSVRRVSRNAASSGSCAPTTAAVMRLTEAD
jgi:hypothetical protein